MIGRFKSFSIPKFSNMPHESMLKKLIYSFFVASFSRKNPFSLLVALDEKGEAMGSMFWDDGESINTVEEGKYNLLGFNYSKVRNLIIFFIEFASNLAITSYI